MAAGESIWKKTPFHCPNCSETEVYFRDDGGDYYLGEIHLCKSCHATFHISLDAADADYGAKYLRELNGEPTEKVFPPQSESPLSAALRDYYSEFMKVTMEKEGKLAELVLKLEGEKVNG